MKKKTTEQFIREAEMVHGVGKYDYSEVEYVNSKSPVILTCQNNHRFPKIPSDLLRGSGCPYCAGLAPLTTEIFIEKAKKVHGDRFGYDLVDYKNSSSYVNIICKKHGPFQVEAHSHLSGKICKECARIESKKPIFGVGINDYDGKVKIDGKHIDSYNVWHDLFKRLFCESSLEKEPIYKDVKICDEWIYFSNFKEWFDTHSQYYHKGWHLDKDLLSRNKTLLKKIYSPLTCVFLPREINGALITQQKYRTDLPIGVRQAESGRYHAILCSGIKKSKHLGTFDTLEEAFAVYKETKESWLKLLANKYKSELDPRAYKALMEYEVKIDD